MSNKPRLRGNDDDDWKSSKLRATRFKYKAGGGYIETEFHQEICFRKALKSKNGMPQNAR